MKLLDSIASRMGFVRSARAEQSASDAVTRKLDEMTKRLYEAAQVNRLTTDWTTTLSSSDSEVYQAGQRLRARSRDLERNNPYVERYLKLIENNVLGSNGVGLQMKARDPDRMQNGELVKGRYDTLANQAVESAWAEWGENCTVDGFTTWIDLQNLVLRSAARDGFCFIIKHKGNNGSPYPLRLQFLEADFLRENYNAVASNGNIIRMGVEMDQYRKPVAYHFYSNNPYDFGVNTGQGFKTYREPAENVIQVYRRTRANQTVGVPWIAPVMMRLQMLDKYDEAELVAARTGASTMGSFEKTTPDGYQGDPDLLGNPTQEMQPGVIMDLPMGVSYKLHKAEHPSTAYPAFIKACLRSIAAGLGVSYNSLASDLEGVNYSSIRAGVMEEREEYKRIQNWFIECFIEPVFDEWFRLSLLAGAIKMPNGSALPASKLDKFNCADWKARRWSWVDPEKDVDASVKAIANGFTSRRAVIAEAAGDVEDVDADIAEDAAMEKARGLLFTNRAEVSKSMTDTYGVAVRAGVVTPNAEDEIAMRDALGLPPMPKEVVKAWKDSGGVKQPITLANGETFSQTPSDAAALKPAAPPPPKPAA